MERLKAAFYVILIIISFGGICCFGDPLTVVLTYSFLFSFYKGCKKVLEITNII